MKFFSTFPFTPPPFHNRDISHKNALFLPPLPVSLVFNLRQSNVIPVYKTNASNKLLVGEGSPAASLGTTGYRHEAVFFHFAVQAVISLKPCGTWKCGPLASLSFCDGRAAVQPFFLQGWPDWCRMTCFFRITPGLNNLQFSLSPGRFAG